MHDRQGYCPLPYSLLASILCTKRSALADEFLNLICILDRRRQVLTTSSSNQDIVLDAVIVVRKET
jgi:hypothetical protein